MEADVIILLCLVLMLCLLGRLLGVEASPPLLQRHCGLEPRSGRNILQEQMQEFTKLEMWLKELKEPILWLCTMPYYWDVLSTFLMDSIGLNCQLKLCTQPKQINFCNFLSGFLPHFTVIFSLLIGLCFLFGFFFPHG